MRERSNHEGDAKDNVHKKNILFETYECRGTLRAFTFFIIVKTITRLNLGHNDKFETKIKN